MGKIRGDEMTAVTDRSEMNLSVGWVALYQPITRDSGTGKV